MTAKAKSSSSTKSNPRRAAKPRAAKATRAIEGTPHSIRMDSNVDDATAEKLRETIGDVLSDQRRVPEEVLSHSEMVEFVIANSGGPTFDLMGDVDFGKAYYSGVARRITTMKFVAYLRTKVLEALRDENLISADAFDYKYHNGYTGPIGCATPRRGSGGRLEGGIVELGVESRKAASRDRHPLTFQSQTTIRTRTVTGDKEAFLLTWDDWDWNEEEGLVSGRYAVSPVTYQSLRKFFGLVSPRSRVGLPNKSPPRSASRRASYPRRSGQISIVTLI